MNINKISIVTSIILAVLIIIVPTTYKVYNNHQKHLIEVVENKIIEAAKKCYYEELCEVKEITLQNLYDLNLLERVSNPISKEYYNTESFVKVEDNTFEFIIKE